MKISQLDEGVGRIVKGVNTTPDVGVDQTRIEAAKFGNNVDKDGRPPTLSSNVKGKSTNVLFNLGLTEGILLKFERDKHVDVLHIMDTRKKHRIEVRGKKGYESGNHDYNDKLHQVLDALGKAANFAELMNGETVSINPKHPHGDKAMRTAKDVLQTESLPKNPIADVNNYYKQQFSVFKPGIDAYLEDGLTVTPDVIRSWGHADNTLIDMLMDYYKSKGGKVQESRYTAQELALLEGGHTLEETALEPKKPGRIFSALNEALDNPYPIRWSVKNDNEWYGHAKEDDFYNQIGIEIKDRRDNGFWSIRFKVGEKMDKTGEGDQFRIFATVVEAIKEWWEWANKNAEVNQITFSSEKILDNSRSKLYNRFAKQFANAINYDFEIVSGRASDIFYLKKPGLEENFADGKKKGKSRPGRVKRAGASCNGSVTDLRKRAKKYSGERGRMYHWCANMKSGKKKK